MKRIHSACILVAAVAVLCTACGVCRLPVRRVTNERVGMVRFNPPAVEEVDEFWTWYWPALAAEEPEGSVEIPRLDSLTKRNFRALRGAWQFTVQESGDDAATKVTITFDQERGYAIDSDDWKESGLWIARVNRAELYEQRDSSYSFRFFIISVEGRWRIVIADTKGGMTPLFRLRTLDPRAPNDAD